MLTASYQKDWKGYRYNCDVLERWVMLYGIGDQHDNAHVI